MSSTSVSNNSREYCLRWNNHQPNLSSFFGTLYSTESFVDVTLVSAEGKKLAAHKLVLSACSPYFQHVFENNPCKHPVVILKDVQYSDLQAIVKFIYAGEVNISQDRINTILKTANSLQVKGLAEVPPEELKRVSCVAGDGPQGVSTIRSHHTPPLTSSASWDPSDQTHEVPRKKLKKSCSATAAYAHGSPSTNGEFSVDSGVGISVSRSMDDGGSPQEIATKQQTSVVQKRVVLPAPPQLLPKSKSLDHNFHREDQDDPDMHSSYSERQCYDDSSVGLDRGYDIGEVGEDMKMEEMEEEGEYLEDEEEYYDDQEDSMNYGYPLSDYVTTPANGKMMPSLKPSANSQSSSSSSTNQNRFRQVLHMPSTASGERRRRGRPLLRQPRIKRSDNEPTSGGGLRELSGGSEFYGRDPLGGGGGGGGDDSNGSTSPSHQQTIYQQQHEREDSPAHGSKIHHSNIGNLPIVRVSQSSPTPPSSPQTQTPSTSPIHQHHHHHHHHHNLGESTTPVIVSTMSISTRPPSPTTVVITPTSHANTTLLRVPSESPQPPSSTVVTTTFSSSTSQLVKQISQPLLPSHTLAANTSSGNMGNNAVIRRQNSTPAPTQQQSRIVQPLKHGTYFHIVPSEPQRALSEDNSGKTYIIDLVPPKDAEASCLRRELKKDSSGEHSGSFSREDSASEDIGSSTSGSSFDDTLPVNRSGHCPALRPGPALGCNFCWNSVDSCGRILRRKTKYFCPDCSTNLCIVPCFQDYHSKEDKKKKPRSKLGLPKPSSM